MKISILAISIFLVLACIPLNGKANYLHERGRQIPFLENLPFDANSVIQRIRSNNHSQSIPFCRSKYNEESHYNKWSREGEFLLDTNVNYEPIIENQSGPSIASNGAEYLIVWQDFRGGTWDIYGARVDEFGIILDSAGIVVSNAYKDQINPSVIFDGVDYFVVWQDYRNNQLESDIYGARVNQYGIVLDSDGIAISVEDSSQECPRVAHDSNNCFVVWQDYRNDPYWPMVYGTRVSLSGVVLDSLGIAVSTPAYDQEFPSVAFDGVNYLVIWQDDRSGYYDIYGTRINTSGIILDTINIPISTAPGEQHTPSVGFDGLNYFVVWDNRGDICGARVSQSGSVLDTSGITISATYYDESSPVIAFDGTYYLITWDCDRYMYGHDIYGARVTPSGVVVDTEGILISLNPASQYKPAVTYNGSNYLVAWNDWRSRYWDNLDIYGSRMTTDGTVLDSIGLAISTAAVWQTEPSAAFDGINYFVVWQEYVDGSWYIYGTRISVTGMLLDTMATRIGSGTCPDVTYNGTNYFVVWELSLKIYGCRVNQDGIILDTNNILISLNTALGSTPSIEFDGFNYLVVWEDYRAGSYSDIYGARVTPSGIVLDTLGIAISTAPGYEYSPSVAFDGANYLVVWATGDPGYDIYGARVDTSGNVLDSLGICISSAWANQLFPVVAFDGANYLVAWEDARYSYWSRDIYAARVSPMGIVLDPVGFPISTANNIQCSPTIAYDGSNYTISWQDMRNDSSYDIYGAKVNVSGVIIDSFPVLQQRENQTSPALAHGQGDQFLIVYSGWCDFINSHPANSMRIWGKFYPFTSITENAGYTVQGVGLFLQVYPNPFKERTYIGYQIPDVKAESQKISLKIYDATGRLVRDFSRFANYDLRNTQIVWHGDDDIGRVVPAGVYFIMVETEGNTVSKKVILLK
jgi:hypothetical protein